MSEYTPNLHLFKYNPDTDGKEVFSLTQALNDNWDTIDNMDLLPDQTDKAGYLLTTNGIEASWGETSSVLCVTETYKDTVSWYRIWSDGWCEQGGIVQRTAATQLVEFSPTYSSTPTVLISPFHTTDSTDGRPPLIRLVTINGFNLNMYTSYAGAYWYACGDTLEYHEV